jgi:Na+/melibiose symporter-like transporter
MEKQPQGYGYYFSAMMVGLKVGLSIGSSLVALIIGKYGYISVHGSEQ